MFPYDAGANTGSVADVRRILLSPRWVAGHVVVTLVFAATLWLAWWQWSRAGSATGGMQNLGYALQWPVFGAFAVFAWVRAIRLQLHPPSAAPVEPAPPRPSFAAPAPDHPIDPELAAYNAHLASLHAADGKK